nr:comB7 lipoprotein [Helicobacter heilmannii]
MRLFSLLLALSLSACTSKFHEMQKSPCALIGGKMHVVFLEPLQGSHLRVSL